MSVVTEIMKMTDVDELQNVADATKKRLDALISAKLRPGSKVQMTQEHWSKKPWDSIGTVERVNQKTISVDFGKGGKWRVSKSMLQIVK